MDWIRQNRFLATYLGVLIAGVLALGAFLLLGVKGYKQTKADYDTVESQVTALEGKRLFPNSEHLAEKKKRVAEYESAVEALKAKATQLQQPLKKGLTERQFRELMNQESDTIAELAAAKKLALPDQFGLGMESYRDGAAVNPKAVPLLEWEMAAIKQFIGHAADAGISSIDLLERDKFPQEDKDWDPEAAAKAAEEAKKAAQSSRSSRSSRSRRRGRDEPKEEVASVANPMATANKVMETFRFSTKLTGSYESLQALLNKLAADDTYFTWVRKIRIENVTKESPTRGGVPGPAPIPDAVPGPDGELPQIDASILFGNEQMIAKLFVDFVRFKEDDATGDGTDEQPAE